MDAIQTSPAGVLPVIATPDTLRLPSLGAAHLKGSDGATFSSVLQSQLALETAAGQDSDVGRAAAGEAEVAEVARQLESLLLYNLLKEMWATVPEGTLLDTGMAGEFYREMWLEALADEISRTGDGIGLADVLAADITRLSL